ncbi:MAG: TCR/Tet family MFS transporter [Albidovulum sp.]|nr:TCR/Tet family MFS transporter [Albidovulum sp.]MDE0305066.1 TCR/Tet family MFS transporter [Albidovulum sp.]MDE0533528.1 TCR/Tet family MFS transporter [Albidovulum sp.]
MKKRLPLLFVLFTVAIDAVGIGLIIPVMPDLLIEVGDGTLTNAAAWGGILSSVFAVMQFVCGPTIGSLSDRYGRRPVLLVSLFFMSLDYLIMGFAHAIWLLLLGRIIGGITAATAATAAAFVSDISTPDEKAQNFGLIGAAFGIGFILGPVLGAAFAELGTRGPFFAAAALSMCNLALGYFVLPETVTDDIRRPFSWKRANPVGGFYHIARLPGLGTLISALFIYQLAILVYPSVWSYYSVERFDWGPRMIGISIACYGVMIALVQGGLIRLCLKFLGERGTIRTGMLFTAIGCLGFGIIDQSFAVFVLIPISALGAVFTPAIHGIMARTALANQQGELQGVIASVNSIAYVFSPLLMTQVFNAFVSPETDYYLPGAPFLVAMVLVLVCAAILRSQKLVK